MTHDLHVCHDSDFRMCDVGGLFAMDDVYHVAPTVTAMDVRYVGVGSCVYLFGESV